jgi:predicted nucleic acid-binding protein
VKVLLDTNILVDVLAKRKPFYADSATIWTLTEQGLLDGLVSAVSFTNVFYIVRKLAEGKVARRTLTLLRSTFTPVACDARILTAAIDADFHDFEDAVQYFSAVQAGADCIISRNPDDFPRPRECPVLTPAEFLATYSFE